MTSGASRLLAGAGLTWLAGRALRRAAAGDPRWRRSNFRGRPVTLTAGPAVGLAALSAAAPGAPGAVLWAGLSALTLGTYDDLAGSGHARGLQGHLRSLRRGQVTTGLVKLVGLGVGGLAAATRLERGGGPVDVVLTGALVAGSANLVNLLDLRPGRALKVSLLIAGPVTAAGGPGAPVAGAVAGAALAGLPADLGERAMLGDAGANTLGALLGVAVAAGRSRAARGGALAGVVALTAASEVVSFTAVIDRVPPLRLLDRLGRAP